MNCETDRLMEGCRIFRMLERWQELERAAREVIKTDESNHLAQYLLASCLEKRENFGEALDHIDRAILLCPGEVKYLAFKANLLSDFNDAEAALDLTSKAVGIEPGNLNLINLHSRILEERGDQYISKIMYENAVNALDHEKERGDPVRIENADSKEDLSVVLKNNEGNRYSFAALLGARQSHEELDTVAFVLEENDLVRSCGELLKKHRRAVVCISAFTSQMPSVALEIVNLKKRFPQVIVIVGGPHASARPDDIICLGADYAVIGGAEETFPALLACVKEGGSCDHIKGIAYVKDGKFTASKPKPVSLDNYLPFDPGYKLFAPIEIQRGCFHSCKYCQTGTSRKVVHRSPESIIECCRLAISHGYSDLRFVTPDSFAYGKKHPKEDNCKIIKGLLERIQKIEGDKRIFFGSFPSEVRPDSITDDLLSIVRDYVADNEIHVGMQAATDRLLRHIRRGHTVADVRKAVEMLIQHDFLPVVHMILSLPGETPEDKAATLQEINRLANAGAKVRVHTFIPLPGTPFENEQPGRLDPDTFESLVALAKKGAVVGHFHKQDKIALEIKNYMQRKGRFASLPKSLLN